MVAGSTRYEDDLIIIPSKYSLVVVDKYNKVGTKTLDGHECYMYRVVIQIIGSK